MLKGTKGLLIWKAGSVIARDCMANGAFPIFASISDIDDLELIGRAGKFKLAGETDKIGIGEYNPVNVMEPPAVRVKL